MVPTQTGNLTRAEVFLNAHAKYFSDIMSLLGVDPKDMSDELDLWFDGKVAEPSFVRFSYWALFAAMSETQVEKDIHERFTVMKALKPFAQEAGLFGGPGMPPTSKVCCKPLKN